MKRLLPRRLRTRLTVWYAAVLAGILALYSGVVCAVFFLQLRSQLDRHAIEELETTEGLFVSRPDGALFLRTDSHDHPYPIDEHARFIEVLSEDGAVVYRNDLLGGRSLGGPPAPGEGTGAYSQRSIRLPGGPRVRLVSRRHLIDNRRTLIRLALSEEDLWQRFFQVIWGLSAGLPLALGLASAGGYILARRALWPIEGMARRAREINAEQLHERLPVGNPYDELGHLAAAFNDTLARLECSFERLRRFTSDAAHELRTPLTAIRSVGEVGLRKQADDEYYRDVIASMLEEGNRLSRLVEGLLAVARADADPVYLERTTVFALTLAQEAAELLGVLAEEKDQTVSVEGDGAVRVEADRVILRQVLVNLLDNAIKYSPVGGRIAIRVSRRDGNTAAIEVEDSGPGIPPEHRDRVFDRFYRTDEARSRETGGVGLGLAIAKRGAEVHGGRLELDSKAGSGSVFRLLVPAP